MQRRGRERLATLTWILALMAVLAGWAAAEEVVVPDDIFFYRPVASVFGQSSVWNNPAALAYRQMGSMIIFSQRDKRVIRDWGGAATMKVLALAYRQVKYDNVPDLKEYIFAIGGGQQYRFGASYRYIKKGPGYLNKRHFWNLGFLLQHSEKVSLGARIENLNRGKIDGVKSDVRFVYGAAARLYRDMITATFDVDMTHKQNLDHAAYRTGVEVRPKPGMYIYADFDNKSRINLGFRLNFGTSYVGHYHNFDRDFKSYRGTTYIGSVSGKQPSLIKPVGKALIVKLDGTLPENQKFSIFGRKPLKYFDYVDGIYQAAGDREIDRMFLNIGELKCGLSKVEELSEAVKYFRAHGKRVVAFINTPNNLGYLMASAADSVIIPPVSQLNLIGLRAILMSIKELMDKVGVEAEVERVDEYKTAPEMFMFDHPTEPNREQINRILDRLYDEMVGTIAVNRHMTADSVRQLIDAAPLVSAEALKCGLVDELAYADDAREKFTGKSFGLMSRPTSLEAYVSRDVYDDHWGERPRLALVIADGDITSGHSGGRVGDFEMLGTLRRVRRDPSIKGVLLRVNSPGGSALASDLIWHEIEKTVEKKPVVISMGNVAASGGYYISSIDGEIFVDRATLTGSIGVFGGKVNVAGLFDKIGIYTETYSRGQNADLYSMYHPFTEEQRRQLREQLWQFYGHFTDIVGTAREISPDSVNVLGRGQVWTGVEAVANGLADGIGGVHQAMEALSRKTGIDRDDAVVVAFPEERYILPDPFNFPMIYNKLADLVGGNESSLAGVDFFGSDYIFFRMPYNIKIE